MNLRICNAPIPSRVSCAIPYIALSLTMFERGRLSASGAAVCHGPSGLAGCLPCRKCPVREHNVCQPLDNDRLRDLYENQRAWTRGQFLYRAGDHAGPIFKIISGIIAVSNTLPDGRRQILDFFFPGQICGYLETSGHYSFDGQALTDVTVCCFTRARFKAFPAAHDDLREVVRAALASKIGSVSRHAAQLGLANSLESVAGFLCWVGDRYSEQGLSRTRFDLPMTRDDIADHLGVGMERVSRTFSELRRLKIIETKGVTVTILDPVRLSALSSSRRSR
jgi:CRP/FNR family transcriptional regulator